MFRPAHLLFVLSSSVSYTFTHFAQYPNHQPSLPGTRRQQPYTVESETYAHPPGSIPAITVHPFPDSDVSSLAPVLVSTYQFGRRRHVPPQEVDRKLLPSGGGTDTPTVHPQTPNEYLQLGIKHHEANRLEESALCFERSAKEQGGCGVGMLMYGLTLRHGWGCPRNEKSGFYWLKKAAELALADLEKGKQGVDAMAIRVSSFGNRASGLDFEGGLVRTHPRDI